jgi:antiviral helicase SKI2
MDLSAILRLDAVQKQIVEEEFIKLYSSWTSPTWDELDWSKVKDLQVRELLVERQKMATIAQNAESLDCPNFVKHVSITHL